MTIRFLDLKGSKDTAEMETTEGESLRNSSGTVSVQLDFVSDRAVRGIPNKTMTQIKIKYLFI